MSVVLAPAFGADNALEKCRDIPDRDARLDCFDSLAPDKRGPGSYLSSLWKLGAGRERIGFDQLQTHRPVYVLLDRWTNNVNQAPSSPAPGHSVTTPLDLNANEVKFQLSFKSEVISHDFGGELLGLASGRLWFAYTQQSHWQLYTPSISRPFRETDYEPELILTLGTANEGDGWKLLNIGLLHQSNGRALPASRSWNRVYAQGGWEWYRVSVLARVWARRHLPAHFFPGPASCTRFLSISVISMRRFFFRPSGVSFSAIGWYSARPEATIRSGGMPTSCK